MNSFILMIFKAAIKKKYRFDAFICNKNERNDCTFYIQTFEYMWYSSASGSRVKDLVSNNAHYVNKENFSTFEVEKVQFLH